MMADLDGEGDPLADLAGGLAADPAPATPEAGGGDELNELDLDEVAMAAELGADDDLAPPVSTPAEPRVRLNTQALNALGRDEPEEEQQEEEAAVEFLRDRKKLREPEPEPEPEPEAVDSEYAEIEAIMDAGLAVPSAAQVGLAALLAGRVDEPAGATNRGQEASSAAVVVVEPASLARWREAKEPERETEPEGVRAEIYAQLGSLKDVLEQRASAEQLSMESLAARLLEAEAALAASHAREKELQLTCVEFETGLLELSVDHARLSVEHRNLRGEQEAAAAAEAAAAIEAAGTAAAEAEAAVAAQAEREQKRLRALEGAAAARRIPPPLPGRTSADIEPVAPSRAVPPTPSDLFVAAREGNPDVVHALLAQGVDADSINREGCTALWWAARMGHTLCVQVLLSAGVTVDKADEDGCTPLMAAAMCGSADLCFQLLQAGADQTLTKFGVPTELQESVFNETLGDEYTTALWLANQLGHAEAIAVLQAAWDGNLDDLALEEAEPPEPLPELELPGKSERDTLFHRMDNNGNGKLSLAEIDKAVAETWPEFNHKPALMRAYRAADIDTDGFIKRHEFRLLLEYLVYFNNLWHKFEEIDSNGDRRLTQQEFQVGCVVIGEKLSRIEARAEFSAMDENGGGYILFDEFCGWCARRQRRFDKIPTTPRSERSPSSQRVWDLSLRGDGESLALSPRKSSPRDTTTGHLTFDHVRPDALSTSARLHKTSVDTSRSVRRPGTPSPPKSPRSRGKLSLKPKPKTVDRTHKFGPAPGKASKDHFYRARAVLDTVIVSKTETLGPSHPETLRSKQSLVELLEEMSGFDGNFYRAREPAETLAVLLDEMGQGKQAKKVRKRLTMESPKARKKKDQKRASKIKELEQLIERLSARIEAGGATSNGRSAEAPLEGKRLAEDVMLASMLASTSKGRSPEALLASMTEMFQRIDVDGSGTLDRSEIAQLSASMGTVLDDGELDTAMAEMDGDDSGAVDQDEFRRWWFRPERMQLRQLLDESIPALQRRLDDANTQLEALKAGKDPAAAAAAADAARKHTAAANRWKQAGRKSGQAAVAVKRIEHGVKEKKAPTAKEVAAMTARLAGTAKKSHDESWRTAGDRQHGIHFGTVEREVAPGRLISPVRRTEKQARAKSAEFSARHADKLERHRQLREDHATAHLTPTFTPELTEKSMTLAAVKLGTSSSSVSERLYTPGSTSGAVRAAFYESELESEEDLRRTMSPELSERSRQLSAKLEDDPGDAFERLFAAASSRSDRYNEWDARRKQEEAMSKTSQLHLSAAELPDLF